LSLKIIKNVVAPILQQHKKYYLKRGELLEKSIMNLNIFN